MHSFVQLRMFCAMDNKLEFSKIMTDSVLKNTFIQH